MSYLWLLDGLSMALGIGELDGCTRSWNTKCHSVFFLNTNFTHEFDLAHVSHFLSTRISRISVTDFEPSARCEWQLVVVVDSLWLLTHCGYWLVVVIDSLWLLTHCGYWLVVVIDLLCFKWQIKKDIREPCEALADPWDPWDPCAK